MVDMDWKAAMDSEVFREYARNEIVKQMKLTAQQEQQKADEEEDKLNILDKFKEFERQVRSSPKKMAIFKALQDKFATDADYTVTVKKSFVDAVMMLDLS